MKYFLLIITFALCSFHSSYSQSTTPATVTLTIASKPTNNLVPLKNPLASITHLANKAPVTVVRANTPPVNNGIMGTYYGYTGVSSFDGQLTFPFKGTKPSFKLLITPAIRPIMMLGNTIHHWELIDGMPAALYSIERLSHSDEFYWEVQPLEIPEKKLITLDTIVLFANPRDIEVPLQSVPTTNNFQLVLPSIWAKQTINRINAPIALLKVRQFFGPLYYQGKQQQDTYYSEQLVTRPGRENDEKKQ